MPSTLPKTRREITTSPTMGRARTTKRGRGRVDMMEQTKAKFISAAETAWKDMCRQLSSRSPQCSILDQYDRENVYIVTQSNKIIECTSGSGRAFCPFFLESPSDWKKWLDTIVTPQTPNKPRLLISQGLGDPDTLMTGCRELNISLLFVSETETFNRIRDQIIQQGSPSELLPSPIGRSSLMIKRSATPDSSSDETTSSSGSPTSASNSEPAIPATKRPGASILTSKGFAETLDGSVQFMASSLRARARFRQK
jgi:hypothetical protein